jgi:hypothetical protein
MTDVQGLVDEMRSCIRSADQTYNDSFKQLAAAYAEACRDANQRLRRCEEFLEKGRGPKPCILPRAIRHCWTSSQSLISRSAKSGIWWRQATA